MQKKYENKIAGYSQLISKRHDQFSLNHWPRGYKSASGKMVTDSSGTQFLDMSISGIGACILGYAFPDVDNAVIQAIKNGVSTSLNSDLEPILAEKLIELHPYHDLVRFCKSGGEANAIAVRICRAFSRKDKVLFCGYHGWHDWYISANHEDVSNLNNHLLKNLSPSGVPSVLKGTSIPFEYSIDSFLDKISLHGDEIGCVIMEPARTTHPNTELLKIIRRETSKRGIPLVFDEISCGFRTELGALTSALEVYPDITVFGKALGNGYPIAALTGSAHVMEAVNETFISSTNWTEATGVAAAIAVIDALKVYKVPENIRRLGEYWIQSFKNFNAWSGNEFNWSGLIGMHYFSHLTHPDEFRTFFTVYALKRNLLVSGRFYPNFSHTKRDIDIYFECLTEAFVAYKGLSKNQLIDLVGPVLPTGFNRLEQT